ncbi:MAG: lipoprotein insertase outer membrane protein LolB [Pseudomonadota bacterium]
MRRWLLLGVLWLVGCASAPPVVAPARPAEAGMAAFAFNGRVAVRYEGRHTSAGVRWTHSRLKDEIALMNPLGQTAALIRSDAQGVVLDTADRHYAAADAESLTQSVLGWPLPLAGLHHWILALPAPHGEPAELTRNEAGQVTVLRQDGWVIRYNRYTSAEPDALPVRIVLERGAQFLIQVVIDEWEIQ